MKKTKEEKKLSIEIATVRRLETQLTPEQLKLAAGGLSSTKHGGAC
jgi:hypothetical protein